MPILYFYRKILFIYSLLGFTMNYCYVCGQQLPLGREKFCPNCGEKFNTDLTENISSTHSVDIQDVQGDVIGGGAGGTGNFIGREIGYAVQGNIINLHVNKLSTEVIENLRKMMSFKTQLPTMADSKEEKKRDAVNLDEIRQTQERITKVLNDVKDIEKKEGREIEKIEVGDYHLLTKDLLVKNALAKATMLYYTDHYREALVWYDKLIVLDASKPDVWYNKGVINGKLEQYNTAIKCFDKAIEIKPDYAEAWYNKGVCLGTLGNHKQAIKCFNKVKAIGMFVQ